MEVAAPSCFTAGSPAGRDGCPRDCGRRAWPSLGPYPIRPARRAVLSSLMPTNRECLKWLSGVHSTNSNCPTNAGLSQWQSFIFTAVKPSPHRPARASGRLANGQVVVSSPRNRFAKSWRKAGVKPLRVRETYTSRSPS
jgi:hypothetical protein